MLGGMLTKLLGLSLLATSCVARCNVTAGTFCPPSFPSVVLPLAGYTIAANATAIECGAPAAKRCPGWTSFCSSEWLSPCANVTQWCGIGYAGPACEACALNFISAPDGLCVPCRDDGSGFRRIAVTPIAIVLAIFVGLGAVIVFVIWWSLECTLWKATLSFIEFASWAFVATQTAAAAFRVIQKASVVSHDDLSRYFTALTSLQLGGALSTTHSGTCPVAVPYVTTWIAVGVTLFLFTLGSAALAFVLRAGRDRAPKALWVFNLACSLTLLCYGPLITAFSSSLLCSVRAPHPLASYLNMAHDGTDLRSQIDTPGSALAAALAQLRAPQRPSAADLERALANATFASSFALGSLVPVLNAPVDFAVVLSDPYSVCFEGPHRAAWYAALVAGVVVVFCVPLLGFWSVGAFDSCVHYVHRGFETHRRTWSFHLARLESFRHRFASFTSSPRARQGAATGGDSGPAAEAAGAPPDATVVGAGAPAHTEPVLPPFSVRSVFADALAYDGLRKGTSFFPFLTLSATGVLSTIASLTQRETGGTPAFVAMMAVTISISLVLAYVCGTLRPFDGYVHWKNTGAQVLYALSAVTSVCSIYIYSAVDVNTVAGRGAVFFVYLPLVFAPLAFVFIIVEWLKATRLVLGAKKRQRQLATAAAAAMGRVRSAAAAARSLLTRAQA